MPPQHHRLSIEEEYIQDGIASARERSPDSAWPYPISLEEFDREEGYAPWPFSEGEWVIDGNVPLVTDDMYEGDFQDGCVKEDL